MITHPLQYAPQAEAVDEAEEEDEKAETERK